MISFEQALEIIINSAALTSKEIKPFTQSVNCVLAEEVFSDMDLPPFNKSAMDGYACRKADLKETLTVIETIPAGVSPKKTVLQGQCSKIMTGSKLPEGADCVIKIEETETTGTQQVRYIGEKTNHNICFKGEDIKAGQQVLQSGTLIQPQHIAVLASVGKTNVLVYRKLKIGILSTGDELVEPDSIPGESSIRNSNAWQLLAQAEKMGLITSYYGIAADEKDDLTLKITRAEEENDMVILTGGVSMGDYDHVPEVLKNLGYDLLIQKIAVQPGSPTLFAVKKGKIVFGLPGNPASSFVQFEMLVKPFSWMSMGYQYTPIVIKLPLASTYSRKKAERLSLIPVIVRDNKIELLDYHGSAHIHAYSSANGILSIEPGKFIIEKGDLGDVRLI